MSVDPITDFAGRGDRAISRGGDDENVEFACQTVERLSPDTGVGSAIGVAVGNRQIDYPNTLVVQPPDSVLDHNVLRLIGGKSCVLRVVRIGFEDTSDCQLRGRRKRHLVAQRFLQVAVCGKTRDHGSVYTGIAPLPILRNVDL